MGTLSGPEIRKQYKAGRIHIEPFVEANLGPNSYDLTLSPNLLEYILGVETIGRRLEAFLDVRKSPETKKLVIQPQGLILYPGRFYLGATNEEAGSDHYVPCIEGRSSMARLGISPHVSAGFGDHGFKRQWTLEITVQLPVRIYPDIRICQVIFQDLIGEPMRYDERASSKYHQSTGVVASRSHLDYPDQ